MSFGESGIVFGCANEELVGVLAVPETGEPASDVGILIVVGGPQYRVGSHRQFLLLSRRLAAAGYPVLRFDVRGMGDSSGAQRRFDALSDDIGAAIEAFMAACTSVKKVVIWGLCDAASAALIYVDATMDARITGLILLNPWVRSEASLAQTQIKHYYGNRLMQKEFWLKLLTGRLPIIKSIRGLLRNLSLARGASAVPSLVERPFQERMIEGWKHFSGGVLLILSGQDYTAMEFLDYAAANGDWSAQLAGDRVTRIDLPDADHTFSSVAFRAAVEDASIDWLSRLSQDG